MWDFLPFTCDIMCLHWRNLTVLVASMLFIALLNMIIKSGMIYTKKTTLVQQPLWVIGGTIEWSMACLGQVSAWWCPSPLQAEASMECTPCPGMLHSQPTGSTQTQTHDMQSQSPMHYPLGHHISTLIYNFYMFRWHGSIYVSVYTIG